MITMPDFRKIEKVIEKERVGIIFLILVFTLFIRICYLILLPSPIVLVKDAALYDNLAINLLKESRYIAYENSTFGNPMTIPPFTKENQPTSAVVPLYPVFLSAIYRIAGHNLQIIRYVQAFLGVLTCLLVFTLSKRLGNKTSVNMISMLMYAVYPPFTIYTGLILTETLFTLLLLIFITSFLSAIKNLSLKMFLISGLLLGLANLCRSSSLLLPILILFGLLYFFKKQAKVIILPFLIFVFGTILAMCPWIIRNYSISGGFIPSSTSGGLALWYSTCEKEDGWFGTTRKQSPQDALGSYFESKESSFSMKKYQLSEIEVNNIFAKMAIQNVKKNPTPYFKNSMGNLFRFWFNYPYGNKKPSTKTILLMVTNAILILFGAVGIFSNNNLLKIKIFPIITILYFMLVHIFTGIATVRYNLPLMPYMMIFASCGVIKVLKKASSIVKNP